MWLLYSVGVWYCWETMLTPNWAWIYDRLHPAPGGGIKPQFYEGVEEFIMDCDQIEQFICEETIRCPYAKCKCRRFLDIESIRYHLYKDGFKLDYWLLIKHGEVLPLKNQFGMGYVGSSSNRVHIGNKEGGNVTWEDNVSHY